MFATTNIELEALSFLSGFEIVYGTAFGDRPARNRRARRPARGPGPDALVGRDGDDFLEGSGGADDFRGGDGEDTCDYDPGGDGDTATGCELGP